MTLFYEDLTLTLGDRTKWTLPEILRLRAETHGDRIYMEVPSTGECFTYAEALAEAEHIASGLLSRGHAQGDRLVIMAGNCSEYILAWLGSGLAGMAEVPVNTAYRGSFLEHQVSTVSPTAVVTSVELAERFIDSAKACETVKRFYVIGREDAEVARTVKHLHAAGFEAEPFAALRESVPQPPPTVRPQDLASVFFTSGTTGLSKGVMMSHGHMYFFADEGAALVKLTDEDTYIGVGPLFHGNTQFLAAYPALIKGARFVLYEKFSASNWRRWCKESGATVANLVGVMSDFLWKQPAWPDDKDQNLRCIWAVPNPTTIVDQWKERFGDVEFVENFGLTEVSMPILTPYGVPRPAGAAGLLVHDWFDIKLVDSETDEEVPVGQMGELVVRPKFPWIITSGYFGMPDRTAEALRNCWFHTGDGMRRDEEGWYYFMDRLKDALRRRGENISSYELEQAIIGHDSVAEVAVVAVPADQAAGEDEVMAFVVLAEGVDPSSFGPQEFWEYCSRRLPYFAVPRYVRFIDALPKTPSEKIQKAKLRDIGADADSFDREKLAKA